MSNKAAYTIRNIDPKFWKELKGETGYRGVVIRSLILNLLSKWVRESKALRIKEKKAGM